MKKRIFCLALLLALLCSCAAQRTPTDEVLMASSHVRLSDLVYGAPYVFTCYKPQDYEIVRENGSRQRRYTLPVAEAVHMETEKAELLADDFYKDAFSEQEDKAALLKDDTLYLAFVYGSEGNYHVMFESFLELDGAGRFVNAGDSFPWKTLGELKRSYAEELGGRPALTGVETPVIRALSEAHRDLIEEGWELYNYRIVIESAPEGGEDWQLRGYWKNAAGRLCVTAAQTLHMDG